MNSKANDGVLELHDTSPTRRQFVRGALGVTAAAGVTAGSTRTRFSPAGEAQAVAPVVAAGYVLAGAGGAVTGAGVGWLLREYEVIGADDPPAGLTADALQSRFYETTRTRLSTNGQTITDNANLVQGAEHVAYTDGKLDAIEQLNQQASQNDVQAAAIDAVDEYETTVKKELLKTWNEATNELDNLLSAVGEHPDVTDTDVLSNPEGGSGRTYVYTEVQKTTFESYVHNELDPTHELPNGEVIDVNYVQEVWEDDSVTTADECWNPTHRPNEYNYTGEQFVVNVTADGGDIYYLAADDWRTIFDDITDTMQSVRDGLITWVDTVYSEVQSGDIDIEDLLTPRERAELMSDDEEYPQAVADLLALNLNVDLEREATIEIPQHNATLKGTLAINDDNATVQTGQTYDPETDFSGSVFFTYDISEGHGDWLDYETGIDGGEVTFTSEPYAQTEYHIETVNEEIAVVQSDDFSQVDGGNWTVDISDQLEDAIADIQQVDYFAQVDGTQYETVQLRDSFEVVKFTDSAGDEHDEANFTRDEPQTNDNYITQDEWDEMEARNKELIEKYEEALNSGGGFDLDFGNNRTLAALAAVAIGVVALLKDAGGGGGSTTHVHTNREE